MRPGSHSNDLQSPPTVPRHRYDALVTQLLLLENEVNELRARVSTADLVKSGATWRWEKDGQNNLESLSCPIVIDAADLRELLAPAPAESDYVGWYCEHCQRGVDASEVTFHEQHADCGRYISNDRPPAPEVASLAREELIELRVLLNESSPNESVLSRSAAKHQEATVSLLGRLDAILATTKASQQ